jgi:hypothetical protein
VPIDINCRSKRRGKNKGRDDRETEVRQEIKVKCKRGWVLVV